MVAYAHVVCQSNRRSDRDTGNGFITLSASQSTALHGQALIWNPEGKGKEGDWEIRGATIWKQTSLKKRDTRRDNGRDLLRTRMPLGIMLAISAPGVAMKALMTRAGNFNQVYRNVLPVGSKSHKRVHFWPCSVRTFLLTVHSISKRIPVLERVRWFKCLFCNALDIFAPRLRNRGSNEPFCRLHIT